MTATMRGSLADTVKAEAVEVMRAADAQHPRSLQTAPGMSEIGGCGRRLAFKLLGVAPVNTTGGDPLAPFIGRGGHTLLEQAYADENTRLGYERYLIEQRFVLPGYELAGNVDLIDLDLGVVVDHKFVGATTMRKVRDGDISRAYRWQILLYLTAARLAGHDVHTGVLLFWPRTGSLRDMQSVEIPYDEAEVERILSKYEAILTLTRELGGDAIPLVPTEDVLPCHFCPHYFPFDTGDLAGSCPGHAPPQTPAT